MKGDNKIDVILKLLRRLKSLLEDHRGRNCLPGVILLINELSDKEGTSDEALFEARSVFKTMMGGMGTLGDFVIWSDDENTRIILNNELEAILSELWHRLGL